MSLERTEIRPRAVSRVPDTALRRISATDHTPKTRRGPRATARGPRSEVRIDQAVRSTASISSSTLILSPTTTPPPSIGMAMSTPNALREISVLAEKPARVPP